MPHLTLVPAFGRDYKSAKAVKADWDAGKDFLIAQYLHPYDGKYINKPQHPAGTTIQIRYDKRTKMCVINPPTSR